jgi:hypothetical protein
LQKPKTANSFALCTKNVFGTSAALTLPSDFTKMSIPANIEAIPYRWFATPSTNKNGKKQGGKVAVMHSNATDFADVLVYEPDNEEWWDLVPADVAIRAAIRGPAQNESDLIAFALPLANQPTETQQRILERMPELQIIIKPQSEPMQTIVKTEEPIAQVQKKTDHGQDALQRQQAKRLQRLVLQGEWIEKHEQQLKVIQSVVSHAMEEWFNDDSDECHSNAMYQMNDALCLLTDIVRDLRYNCHCPDESREGVLYYHSFNGGITEVVDLSKVPKK